MSLAKYNKALLSAAGVIASFAYWYSVSHPSAWISAVLAVATALGVFSVPNKQ